MAFDDAVGEQLDGVGLKQRAVVSGALGRRRAQLLVERQVGSQPEARPKAHGQLAGALQSLEGVEDRPAGDEHGVEHRRDAQGAGDRALKVAQAGRALVARERRRRPVDQLLRPLA